ncbi:MAG: VPLPA-CTERM sorting domain-containing protein [Pseudomonadota bacterium]
MNGFFKAAAAALLLVAGSAHAATAWDEGLDGDLSGDPLAPTAVTFAEGVNSVNGSMSSLGDTRDYLTFTIPDGQQLVGILLQQYMDLDTGGPGNRGFYAISAGASSEIPSGGNPDAFLGGAHLDPFPAGTDLLARLTTDSLTGTGVTAPLGAGTYTFLVQQTGPQLTEYSLDFIVAPVPVPAAVWLLASGLVGLAGLRRRRA